MPPERAQGGKVGVLGVGVRFRITSGRIESLCVRPPPVTPGSRGRDQVVWDWRSRTSALISLETRIFAMYTWPALTPRVALTAFMGHCWVT